MREATPQGLPNRRAPSQHNYDGDEDAHWATKSHAILCADGTPREPTGRAGNTVIERVDLRLTKHGQRQARGKKTPRQGATQGVIR